MYASKNAVGINREIDSGCAILETENRMEFLVRSSVDFMMILCTGSSVCMHVYTDRVGGCMSTISKNSFVRILAITYYPICLSSE